MNTYTLQVSYCLELYSSCECNKVVTHIRAKLCFLLIWIVQVKTYIQLNDLVQVLSRSDFIFMKEIRHLNQ